MKRLKLWILPLLALPFFTACEDDEVAFSADADVFISGITTDEGTLYASNYYLYGNQKIKSATVTLPNQEETIDLDNYQGLSSTFYQEPTLEDHLDALPTPGTYTFQVVTGKGEQLTYTDRLESNVVEAPTITSFNMEDDEVYVEWDNQDDVDAYQIQLIEESSKKLIFSTNLFKGEESYTLTKEDISYASSIIPQSGESYILTIKSFLFEQDANTRADINIQCISTRQNPFDWQ